jgi:hypothetical protein
MKNKITFDDIPQTLAQILERFDNVESIIRELSFPSGDKQELLTVKEAASFLHLSVPTIYS